MSFLSFIKKCTWAVALLCVVCVTHAAQTRPSLVLTPDDIEALRSGSGPLLEQSMAQSRALADEAIEEGIIVPWPEDAGGGYTHERHKKNYNAMYAAAIQYQVGGQERYLNYVTEMLMAYADMYVDLPLHPEKKEQTPGRIFWQSLNEAVWLVHVSQSYDMVADALSEQQKSVIKEKLLFPVADYLSKGQPQTFNKIHNHGTWAVAAVGMVGYATGREDYQKQALLGLDESGDAGFLRQLDDLFSPDGYYTEGPYYQRYALLPFIWFASAIENNDPDREIFEYRDQILIKATYTTIELSYAGLFIPINDAIKDKGIKTQELVNAVGIVYGLTGDNELTDIARKQERVALNAGGAKLSQKLATGELSQYDYVSRTYRDGADGDQGALTLLRDGDSTTGTMVVAKNTSQGMGHGHYDRLNWQFYDNGNEIVSDYGAARYLNVEAKYGGHYLPENDSWAKQTVAHNTLVVDRESQFDAELDKADDKPAEQLYFSTSDTGDISIGRIVGAHKGVQVTRTLALVRPEAAHPVVIDVVKVDADKRHDYHLPMHFKGQIIDHSLALKESFDQWKPVGKDAGYQHMFARAVAEAEPDSDFSRLTWLLEDRFYSYSFGQASQDGKARNADVLFFELGANDPKFNLKRGQGVLRRAKSQDMTFYAVMEPHGVYDGTDKFVRESASRVESLSLETEGNQQIINLNMGDIGQYRLIISYEDGSADARLETVQ